MKKCMNRKFAAGIVLIAVTMAALTMTAGCTAASNSQNPQNGADITGNPSSAQDVTGGASAATPATPVSQDRIKATWVSVGKVAKFDDNRYTLEYSFVDGGRGILIFYDNGDKYLFEEPFGWEYAGADNATGAQVYRIEYFSKLNGLTDEVRLLPDGKTLTDSNGIKYAMSKLSQAFAGEGGKSEKSENYIQIL